MWVYTTDGFYSVVEAHNVNRLMVRARVRGDLVSLCNALNLSVKRIADDWDTAKDYPYRVLVTRQQWSDYLVRSVGAIDYTNFKDAVKRTQGAERATIYAEVWGRTIELERGRPPLPIRRTAMNDPVSGMRERVSEPRLTTAEVRRVRAMAEEHRRTFRPLPADGAFKLAITAEDLLDARTELTSLRAVAEAARRMMAERDRYMDMRASFDASAAYNASLADLRAVLVAAVDSRGTRNALLEEVAEAAAATPVAHFHSQDCAVRGKGTACDCGHARLSNALEGLRT